MIIIVYKSINRVKARDLDLRS